MQILADENIPRVVVDGLRNEGYNLHWIAEAMPGASDEEVLAVAMEQERTLLTFDKDFGNLVFKTKLPAGSGIILYRGEMDTPTELAKTICNIISSRSDWIGHFSVIDGKRIGMTKLPLQ